MSSKAKQNFLKIYQEKHVLCINNTDKIYSMCLRNFTCFPCLEKVRTKFPVSPVDTSLVGSNLIEW